MTSIQKNQINYILTLAKTGSFSESAVRCYITQSTLSTMIKKYEEQIGFQIFNRKTKPISLTPEGESIINQLRVIQHEFENLEELVKETKLEINGTFKIGVIPTVAPFLLPRFLNSLVIEYPNIEFSIFEITTNEIVQKIKLRELDVGIVSIPLLDSELNERSLFVERFMVYDARKGKKKKHYKVGDLDLDRLWLLEEGHCMRNQVRKICNLRKNRTFKSNLVFNSGSVLSLIELVKISEGITLLPKLAIENNLLLDKNCVFPLVEPVPTREIGLVTHVNFVKKRLLRIIEETIKKTVEKALQTPDDHLKINPF